MEIRQRHPLAFSKKVGYKGESSTFWLLYRFFMKIANSLRTLKARHENCRVVRRRGRLYVINKTNPKFKARQGY